MHKKEESIRTCHFLGRISSLFPVNHRHFSWYYYLCKGLWPCAMYRVTSVSSLHKVTSAGCDWFSGFAAMVQIPWRVFQLISGCTSVSWFCFILGGGGGEFVTCWQSPAEWLTLCCMVGIKWLERNKISVWMSCSGQYCVWRTLNSIVFLGFVLQSHKCFNSISVAYKGDLLFSVRFF